MTENRLTCHNIPVTLSNMYYLYPRNNLSEMDDEFHISEDYQSVATPTETNMSPSPLGGWVRADIHCIVLLFYVHGKHLRSCRDGQLT